MVDGFVRYFNQLGVRLGVGGEDAERSGDPSRTLRPSLQPLLLLERSTRDPLRDPDAPLHEAASDDLFPGEMALRRAFVLRSLDDWDELAPRVQDAHERSLHAKRDMVERGFSRREALSRYHLDARTFQRHVGSGMEKRGRLWTARRGDRVPAVMSLYAADAETKVRILTKTAKERREVAEHTQLIQAYRKLYIEGAPPGESQERMEADLRAKLAAFEGKTAGSHPYLTDTTDIEERIDRDTLEPEGPYPDEP